MYNDSVVNVIRKEVEEFDEEETTYNFEVEGYHTYYVGESHLLVHNACGDGIEADLGNKAEYAFGNAKGSPHNIQRSQANATQLRKSVYMIMM